MRVNMDKSKVMVTGKEVQDRIKSGRWPCSVCGRGVGVNSIICTRCDTWCHKRCSGLQRVVGVADFMCPACASPPPQRDDDSIILNEDTMQEMQHFCYLSDVLDRDAGVERSVRARISAAWAK